MNSSAHACVDLPVTVQLHLSLDHFPIGSLVSGMTGESVGGGNLLLDHFPIGSPVSGVTGKSVGRGNPVES